MAGIVFPDIGRTLLPLIAMDRQAERDRQADSVRQQQLERQAEHDRQQFGLQRERLGLDQKNLDFNQLLRADANQRQKIKDAADWQTQTAMGLKALKPEARPGAYKAAIAEGKARGYDLSSLPPEYTPDVDAQLDYYIQRGQSVKDYLDRQDSRPVPMGPGGAAAPAAPGAPPTARAAAATSGIESGGRYDAVGPVADKSGDRAWGKYQVMGANIPQWSQVYYGQTLTPQQFLNNPDAQEAVFHGKFGEYMQKYGPEGAARAWFAGEGGMNDPNRRDVLGTTVAGYAGKFSNAYGVGSAAGTAPPPFAANALAPAPVEGMPQAPPAPGNVPLRERQPPIPEEVALALLARNRPGDMNVPHGDMVAPGMPGQPAADVRGVQLPPGARIVGIKGQPIVKDGTVMIVHPDGRPDFVPLPQRKEPATGLFPGNSVEANALNQLIARGVLSEQQALELAAGKVITDPSTGQMIFKRPTELVGGGQALPTGQAPQAGAPTSGVPLTPPKKSEAFRKLETEARAVDSAIGNFLDIITDAGGGSFSAFINNPQSPEAQKVLGAFNALKTALRSEAFVNTGVLQPKEMEMLDSMLLAPTTIRGALATPQAYRAMLGEIQRFVHQKIDAAYQSAGISKPGAADQGGGTGGPRPGDVQDGYRFKGGDPSKPESWEKVQ